MIAENTALEVPPLAEESEKEGGLFPIVGIGASAGGLEAFTEVLRELPPNTGMGYVFVQHLDPKHVSILTELLQRHTEMPVQEATENMRVEPNHVYVIPRNKHMGIARGVLSLSPRGNSPSPHMPIDPFLRSLAADQKSKAIGIILSGNASDGALGMMAIKAAGGITFAQSGESSRFDGMPRAAVSSGCIDFTLPPQEIARELARLGQHPYISPDRDAEREPSQAMLDAMNRILGLVRSATGVDFTYYKPNTIRRRILRRMALRQVDHLDRYIERLRSDLAELHALYDDLLINVTEFFRDPDVFEHLKKVVFPQLAPKGHQTAAPVRIWVPGCASGEEVYSLAIAFLEYLGERNHEVNVQIFGTDISESALERARSGTYTPGVVQNISPERMRRFFTKVDSNYQIAKRIREMCVFAKQNLIKDPPFSRLDLISCRNVLIYLSPVLQKRVVPVFHYALRPSGFLLLGSSETIGAFGELFVLQDKKAKIYTRTATATRSTVEFPVGIAASQRSPVRVVPGDWSEAEMTREADRIVIGKYGPAGVVVDGDLNVVQFRGRMAPFLEPSSGMASLNLLKLVRDGLSLELRKAFHHSRRENVPVRREGLRLRHDSTFVEVNLDIIPFRKAPGRDTRYLILFEQAPRQTQGQEPKGSKRGARAADGEAQQLRQELVATKEYLQSVIEELESSNEELRSANEEIQSSNEELQSTNEEMETAKEELQSSNEELNTVNEELQTRNLQLAQAGNDLLNLLENVNIPIIMVGMDLRIRRFTPISQRLLNLIPSDIGRPISDINLNLEEPKLDRQVAEVIDTLTPRMSELRDFSGRPYSLRIRPYRTKDNKIDGAVIVLVDLEPVHAVAVEALEHTPARRVFSQTAVSPADSQPTFGTVLLMAQEQERRHLALEIHDNISQRLALLELTVETLEKSPDASSCVTELRSIREQIGWLSESLRNFAYQLHPATLEHLGLAKAVESYVREFSERLGIQIRYQAANLPGVLDPQVALSLYRIVQEALRNVEQHSQAKAAEVRLSHSGSSIQLHVKDSGVGFELPAGRKRGGGLGLRSMEERARACGGGFRLSSHPGSGTEIQVEIPDGPASSG